MASINFVKKEAKQNTRRLKQPYRKTWKMAKKSPKTILLIEPLGDDVEKIFARAKVEGMAAILAHEIRNPLQSITMASDMLRKIVEAKPEAIELLGEIDHGTRSLATLVNELLQYSRPLNLDCSPQPLQELVEQAVQSAAKNHSASAIQYVMKRLDKRIFADPSKMRLALRNIIRNALDAMSEGGTLTIESHPFNRNNSRFVKITITDTGDGMSEEDLRRIDEPFFSTKALGTGLGFPLAKKIIKAHEGNIKVKSKPGKGTTVEITVRAA